MHLNLRALPLFRVREEFIRFAFIRLNLVTTLNRFREHCSLEDLELKCLEIHNCMATRNWYHWYFVSVHKHAKKEQGQYPAILTEQTWSIKHLLYGFWGKFACGIQRVVPSRQDGSILSARVAKHSARFGSSCPLAELAKLIKWNIDY